MFTLQQARDIYTLADWFYGGHEYLDVTLTIDEIIERGIRSMIAEMEMAEDVGGGCRDE